MKTQVFSIFLVSFGSDIFQACITWLNRKEFPVTLNDTLITLWPKCNSPTSMRDFRAVALYKVLYTLIAKVLANRLKVLLPYIISPNQ